ncbi:MAG: ROK family protein, partial [Clostridia bacterium]
MEIRGKSSQQMIKDANLKLIFSLIGEYEPISRADLKKMTGLSATTVSTLCEELLLKKLIVEIGMKESATSGRKAILLSINPNGGYFCGVEIGQSLCLDVYDLNFRRIAGEKRPVSDWKQLAACIASVLKKLAPDLKQHGAMLGLTVGVPASIDTENNRILSSTVLEQLDPEEDVIGELQKTFPEIPILLCNDSSLIAYAEKEFGNHARNLVSIDISEGVGSGIVIDGGIYAGSGGMAGEFGHVSVDLN